MSAASYARFTSLLALMALAGAFVVVVFRRRLAGGFTVRMALSGGLAVAAPKGRVTDRSRAQIRAALARAGNEITTLWGGSLPPAIATLWRTAA